MTQMADGHLGLDLDGRWPFRLASNSQWWTSETSDVTWSQKPTLVCTLNPELMLDPSLLIYRFAKVTIYLGFSDIATIFDIFKLLLIIKLIIKFDDQLFETGGHLKVLQRV